MEWVKCPICGNKTRNKIRDDTELNNFPLFCPKCKQESLIAAKGLQVRVIHTSIENIVREPGAKTQSQTH